MGLSPHDFPPAETVRLQAHRWFTAGCFENAAHELCFLAHVEKSRTGEPTVIDRHMLQSTLESGYRADFDGAKKRKGTKVHLAVDTLGHFLAVLITPANEQDRAQVFDLCLEVQKATGVKVGVRMPIRGIPASRAVWTRHRQVSNWWR